MYGFAEWLADCRQSAAASNSPSPPWLATDEAARKVYDQMAEGSRQKAARSTQHAEGSTQLLSALCHLPSEMAQLRQRVADLEYLCGTVCRGGNQRKPGVITEAIGDALGKTRAELLKEIGQLREEIEELKRHRLKWHGVYEYGSVYPEGAIVTKGGSAWYCTKETRGNAWCRQHGLDTHDQERGR